MKNAQSELNRVDTLIITVGTRQVGWRCKDGIIRSFGADGNIGYPRHINELYDQLGIPRGVYQENDKTYPWSARDLGERFYNHCLYELDGDFGPVELLLDGKIIEAGVKQGLKHVILWATDQPEKVSWFYRRLDTVWLAKLMEGKIKSLWGNLRVDVHAPVIEANDGEAIREELEQLILREALSSFAPDGENQFVLWIQNKGCTPAIASGVEICAAALVRQCQVFNATPVEPAAFFEPQPNGFLSASPSLEYKLVPMGDYFWPLERLRVISAWERGDFSEAQIWLKLHQNRHKILYKLAGLLALSTNWENSKFYQLIGDWIGSKDVLKLVGESQVQDWQSQLRHIQENKFAEAWESSFLIDLPLCRQNCTGAFIQFAQTLERLLYLHSQSRNWIGKGYITIPPYLSHLGTEYQPGLGGLINGWGQFKKFNAENKWFKLLHRIREKRNKVIHEAAPVTLANIRSIWADEGLFPVKHSEDPEVIKDLMMGVLREVCAREWQIPEKPLVRSLYEWGLKVLREESAVS